MPLLLLVLLLQLHQGLLRVLLHRSLGRELGLGLLLSIQMRLLTLPCYLRLLPRCVLVHMATGRCCPKLWGLCGHPAREALPCWASEDLL